VIAGSSSPALVGNLRKCGRGEVSYYTEVMDGWGGGGDPAVLAQPDVVDNPVA